MRYISFLQNGAERFGVLDGENVRPFAEPVTTLQAYLALPPPQRQSCETQRAIALEGLELLAPARPAKNIFCVGRNYMGHAEEVARARGTALNLPKVPTFFTKAPTSVAHPGATLHLSPELSQQYDWEAELAVVIAARCRDVSEADALDVIFGYTCLNDVTARDLQKEHQQWFKGKSLDETCPIGPWIVGADEIGDPQSLDIAIRIDGETKQSSNTRDMIFSVRTIVASLSAGMTLEAGDVIATGTPDGVGLARTPPEFLRDGTTMDVEIEKIGVLHNVVSFHKAAVAH